MARAAHAGCLAALLAWALPASAALRIEVESAGLSPTELDASRTLAMAALDLLPPAFRARLDQRVHLAWRDDLGTGVHGRARGDRIALDRALLAGWIAGSRDPDAAADHRPALAALLHELAHVYDRAHGHALSRDPRLLDLAGWPARPLRLGLRTRRNDFHDRSPDRYELASPREFVAVNLEHFLLDPGYACRRPALHRHFAALFGGSPAAGSCAGPGLAFVAAGEGGEALRLLALEPGRVQSVEYLLAEANARPMSRWGHGMLRLVVCAPGRPRGHDCRFDLEHHLVLSFRAFVDDMQVSSWRGLTGAYPSRLFVLPLGQVVDEYTKVELRGLRSIPLRLDEAEVASLLERAAQVHWSYDGRYRFVDNNCAVEAWTLLQAGVPRLARAQLRSITPNGLLRRLERAGIADPSVLDDAAVAVRDGYRFDSQERHFQAMLDVARADLPLPAREARTWLAMDPVARAPWLAQGNLRATAAFLLLEQAAVRREQAAIREALKQRFLRAGRRDEALVAAGAALHALLGDGALAGRPALLLPAAGYGLPQADEQGLLAEAVAVEDRRLQGLQASLQAEARRAVAPSRRARLDAAEANLAHLGTRLRVMAQGGDDDAAAPY